ncbi:MAG TPA: DUF3307 domain-containing protein [Solirubrobacteraceae bacterium]|jgi:hypothetical protein
MSPINSSAERAVTTGRWTSRFADLLAAHALADFVLQTGWQARYKRGGLGSDARARKALASHVGVYTLACAGVLAGVARSRGPVTAALTAAAIALPHAAIDDKRLLGVLMRKVKKVDIEPVPAGLSLLVDQSAHLLSLWTVSRVLGDD